MPSRSVPKWRRKEGTEPVDIRRSQSLAIDHLQPRHCIPCSDSTSPTAPGPQHTPCLTGIPKIPKIPKSLEFRNVGNSNVCVTAIYIPKIPKLIQILNFRNPTAPADTSDSEGDASTRHTYKQRPLSLSRSLSLSLSEAIEPVPTRPHPAPDTQNA